MLKQKLCSEKFSLFVNLSEEEINIITGLLQYKEYKAKDIIIEEKTTTNELFLLQKGVVEISKSDDHEKFVLAELGEGEIFGEVAFVDLQGRSSTVQAKTDVQLFSLKQEDLQKIPDKFDYLQYKFPLQITRITMQRFRTTNEKALEQALLRNRFARFVILLVIGFSMTTCFAGFYEDMLKLLPSYWTSAVAAFFTGLLSFVAAKIVGQPLGFFGLTFDKWRQALVEGFLISILLVILFYLLFPIQLLWNVVASLFATYRGLLYIPVVLLQGFIFWGVLQTSLKEFYQDKRGYAALFIAAIGFAVSHAPLGFLTTAASFFMACLLGTVYMRHRNLIGVSIIHYFMGLMAIALGLLKL